MTKSFKEEQEATTALWVEYKKNSTKQLQEQLVIKYTPLVIKIASKFKRKKPLLLDFEDLCQAGREGLLDAIEKFDPNNSRKAQFQTYATFRIHGAIVDQINGWDWTPRVARQNIKEVLKGIDKLYMLHGKEPTVQNILSVVKLDEATTRQALGQISRTYIVHMDNEIIDVVGPTTDHATSELNSSIRIAMGTVLTPLERRIIWLKFFLGLNNKEVQEELELKASELKIIRETALFKLSKALGSPSL